MKRRTLSALITIALIPSCCRRCHRDGCRNGPEPPAIRITPPAPFSMMRKRLEELAARRKKVADTIGPKSIMVLFGAEPRVYTNDVDFPFRQENNFFYLTNLNQQREILC
jgi:Xaa-Pro aminopeptidase